MHGMVLQDMLILLKWIHAQAGAAMRRHLVDTDPSAAPETLVDVLLHLFLVGCKRLQLKDGMRKMVGQ